MKYKYLTLSMLGLCSTMEAQEVKPITDTPPPVSKVNESNDKIADLMAEANKVQLAFMKKVKAQKDRAKMMKMYRDERPDMKPVAMQILELAKKDPDSVSSGKGLCWAYGVFSGEGKKEVLDLLLKHHQDKEIIYSFVSNMVRGRVQPDTDALTSILAVSKDEKLRQTITSAIALIYSRTLDKKDESLKLYKQLVAWPDIAKSNPKLLARVKQQIFIAENLSVGKVAPDIVGTDQEDKEFKLSDYRGKVVMINFWGIW